MYLKQVIRQGRWLYNVPLRLNARHASTPSQQSSSSCSPFADGGSHCTMNDLPIPEGDWNEWYSRRNSKNTIILAIGVSSLLFSIIMIMKCDRVPWNYSVPDYDD